MRRNMLYIAGVVIAAIALTACGWHPRGSREFAAPMHQLHLEIARPGEQVPTRVAQLLTTSGVELLGATANVRSLHIGAERHETRKVSLDRSARSAEQEMRVTVEFDLRDADGTVLLGPRTASASRIYAYDQNSIVALQSEEELIRRELCDSVAEQIVRQLHHASLVREQRQD